MRHSIEPGKRGRKADKSLPQGGTPIQSASTQKEMVSVCVRIKSAIAFHTSPGKNDEFSRDRI